MSSLSHEIMLLFVDAVVWYVSLLGLSSEGSIVSRVTFGRQLHCVL
jgi:hypothetical protein